VQEKISYLEKNHMYFLLKNISLYYLINQISPKMGAMESYRRKGMEEFFSKMDLILKHRGNFKHFEGESEAEETLQRK